MKEKVAKKMLAKLYLERFKSKVIGGMWFETKEDDEEKREQIVINDSFDHWKQCYPLERGAKKLYSYKARKKLPPYWFVNDKGDLISVHGKTPKFLKKDHQVKEPKGYGYHYDRNKNIEAHNLVGLVFESKTFGDAEKLIKKHGLKAFGNKPGQVNGHHQDGNKENNTPSNIVFTTVEAHRMAHKINEENMSEKGKVAAVQEPNSVTMVIEGKENQRQLIKTNRMLMSERAAESLGEVSNSIITLMLAKDLGIEYFREPRTVFIDKSNKLVSMTATADDEVETTEINPSSGMRIDIICRLNENNKIEYALGV